MTTEATTKPTSEELDAIAREHVFPTPRPIGHTTMLGEGLDGGSFMDVLHDFLRSPQLQHLVYKLAAADDDEAGQRHIDLTLAFVDLLQASGDHQTRVWETDLDGELASIVTMALTPDEALHSTAMRRYDAWRQRRDKAALAKARTYAPHWWDLRRRRAQRAAD